MSHIVSIKTRVTDPAALSAACRRLGLSEPVHGTATLFAAQASGLIVKLPNWHYPVVVDTATGEIAYDNYVGAWGEQKELDTLLQAYPGLFTACRDRPWDCVLGPGDHNGGGF